MAGGIMITCLYYYPPSHIKNRSDAHYVWLQFRMLPLFIPVWSILTVPGVESALSLYWEILHALLQSFFHHSVNDFLCNWILEGMWDCGRADTYFVSNVIFLPALYVKLNDLHVHRLQGLQGNVLSRGYGPVLLSVALWNSLKLYYFNLFYIAGAAGSIKFQYLF